MIENLEEIIRKIGKKDERIVGIIRSLYEEIGKLRGRRDEFNDNLDKIIESAINNARERYRIPINLYPSDKKGRCQEMCVCYAVNKWNARSNARIPGFKNVVSWLSNYWLKCKDINKATLIITTAWDEKDFCKSSNLKDRIDSYTVHSDKTVVIVLLTAESISLQYIK